MKWPVIDSLSIHLHILRRLTPVISLWQRALWTEANQVVKSSCKKSPLSHWTYTSTRYIFSWVSVRFGIQKQGCVSFKYSLHLCFQCRGTVQVAASTDASQITEENLMWRLRKTTQEHFITQSLTTKMVLPGAASQSTLDIPLSPKRNNLFTKLFHQQLIDLWRDGLRSKTLLYWNYLVKLLSFYKLLNSKNIILILHTYFWKYKFDIHIHLWIKGGT